MTSVTSPPYDQSDNDTALLALVAQGDRQAFEILYDRYSAQVHALIKRIVHDPMVADELLQESFLQVWRKADSYHGKGAAAAWLFRIARNRSLDELRQRNRRPNDNTGSAEDQKRMEWVKTPQDLEQEIEDRWTRYEVLQALEGISPDQRRALQMAYYEDMSHSEIASATSIPLGTIKTRIYSGLRAIARTLHGTGQ